MIPGKLLNGCEVLGFVNSAVSIENLKKNKKVLLHEHKRHTVCCIASAPSVVLTRRGIPVL